MRRVRRNRCAGFSLVEVVVASGILFVVMMTATAAVHRELLGFGSMERSMVSATRGQEMLARLEETLLFARGTSPNSPLVESITADQVNRVRVGSVASFPDQGSLIVSRGTASEERMSYARTVAAGDSFDEVGRGLACTNGSAHLAGTVVWWAGVAETLTNQVAPAANSFDGIAQELSGPVFFLGDGIGFTYQVPTDPTGGTNYIVNGEVSWGSNVGGQPIADGRYALYYAPARVVTEQEASRDINRDGDRNDSFDLGEIRMRSWDPANPATPPTEITLCPPVIMQEVCNWGGDLDGDGFADPIFLWSPTARSLHIRLLIGEFQNDSLPIIKAIDSVIYLRNS